MPRHPPSALSSLTVKFTRRAPPPVKTRVGDERAALMLLSALIQLVLPLLLSSYAAPRPPSRLAAPLSGYNLVK